MRLRLTPRETPITVGTAAPDFTLKDQNRNEWKLSDAVKKGDVVLIMSNGGFDGIYQKLIKALGSR